MPSAPAPSNSPRLSFVSLLCCAALLLFPALFAGCSEDDLPDPNEELPDPPTGLQVTAVGDSSVSLRWTHADPEVLSYEVQARPGQGVYQSRGTVYAPFGATVNFADNRLVDRTDYAFRVRSRNDLGSSDWSEPVTARTRIGAPRNVRATATSFHSAVISWEFVLPNPDAFLLARRAPAGDWAPVEPGPGRQDRSFTDGSLEAFADYEYRMRAIDDADSSDWSGVAAVRVDGIGGGVAGALERLDVAYATREPAVLDGFYAADFSFEFAASDRAGDPTVPQRWGLADELVATSELLTGRDVSLISLDFESSEVLVPDPTDPVPSTARKVFLEHVALSVVRDVSGEPIEFEVQDGRAELFLRETSELSGSGERIWEVILWRDLADGRTSAPRRTDALSRLLGGGRASTETITWGALKRSFHRVEVTPPARSLSGGPGSVVNPAVPDSCGIVTRPVDGPYDTAIAWGHDGVAPGQVGSFAQRFEGRAEVCALILDLSKSAGSPDDDVTFDLVVWQDQLGFPGPVVCVRPGVRISESANIDSVAVWPSVSRHWFQVDNCCVEGAWWAGFHPNWPGAAPGFYLAGSSAAGETPAFTHVGPGLGLEPPVEPGWRSISSVWSQLAGVGIAVETRPCEN